MKKSITGYKKNSKDKNEPILEIPSSNITMRDVLHPVFSIGTQGVDVMEPGQDYKFNTSSTIEIPYKMKNKKQKGGTIKEFESYLSSLEETDQDELLDYMETMDYENQQEFLKGGRVQWESYQKGGDTLSSKITTPRYVMQNNKEVEISPASLSRHRMGQAKIDISHLNTKTPSFDRQGSGKVKSKDRYREKEQGGLIYQDGGETSLIPVEVEGKETIVKPNGELYKFEGPKHKHGGIDILAEPGSKIFSHHSKAPEELIKTVLGKTTKKKMSYADISKKFDTTKWSKVLQNPDSDEYQKKTAELKMSGNLSMLETIFQTQEEEKEAKGIPSSLKAQKGLKVEPTIEQDLSPLQRLKTMYNTLPEVTVSAPANRNGFWADYPYGREGDPARPVEKYNDDWNVLMNGVPGEFILPQGSGTSIPSPQRSVTPEPPTRNVIPAAPAIPTRNGKPSGGKSVKNKVPTIPDDELVIESLPNYGEELSPIPTLPLPSSLTSMSAQKPNMEDYKVTPLTPKEEAKKNKGEFGIDSKLAGTVLDIGLALSDNINVKEPNLWDLRKNPLFTRFVDFDDKEAGRNLSLSIQQIQNSNMPEDVKQARIADMNAQYQDHTAKVAFGNAQRYESKLNQDTEKLQTYINNNIDQHHQDVERYNQQKAHVDYLRDQFVAQRKSRVTNSVRNYLDYVDRTYKQNKLLSENYEMNPFSGRINFKGNTKDALKQKESEMAQYQQNIVPIKNLPNGAVLARTPSGVEIIIDSTGKATVVK